jgi:hypothetical protein
MLLNLYQAVLYYVLWVTCNIHYGDFFNVFGNEAATR